MQITMVSASVYRTDANQVARDGKRAFGEMRFNANNVSEAQARCYCRALAERDGIINPRIEVRTFDMEVTA